MGMRAFSGVTVGFVGSAIGIHWSLAFSAAALWVVTSGLLVSAYRRGKRATPTQGVTHDPA
jgi:hypothetical protein